MAEDTTPMILAKCCHDLLKIHVHTAQNIYRRLERKGKQTDGLAVYADYYDVSADRKGVNK